MTEKKLVVTTSWDDGYPADSRLGAMLAKHGVKGTFYVPNRNAEGRPVMTENEVRCLAHDFEIGGHSIDHVVLTDLDEASATIQVTENKRWLEDLTGRSIPGFCYVQGRFSPLLKSVVQKAGFEYARTVVGLYGHDTGDAFEMPTTLQLYPHKRSVYLKNFLRGSPNGARASVLWAALAEDNLEQRIDRVIDLVAKDGGTFHLWGHSWEVEELDLWSTLDGVLGRLAARGDVTFATNHQAHRAMRGH